MTHLRSAQHLWSLSPGTVVRVRHGWYDHVGLVGDHVIRGERSVMAFSAQARGFVEEPFSLFSKGRPVRIDGYLGLLSPDAVMRRARLKQAETYSWTEFNCEHFVRYAHGTPIESPQLKGWAVLAGCAGVITLLASRG